MRTQWAKFTFVIWAAASTGLHAQIVYNIEDRSIYTQTSSSAPVAEVGNTYGNPGPYNFRAQSPDNTYASITVPGGTTYSLTYDNTHANYDYYSSAYASQASLEMAFPDGSYTFNPVSTAPSETLTLTGDDYTNVPQITMVNGSAATWINGDLYLDPTITNTLTWTSFTNSTNAAGYNYANGGNVTAQFNGPSFAQKTQSFGPAGGTAFTSIMIAAGSLTPGDSYSGDVNYDLSSDVINPSPGVFYAAAYQVDNYFTIYAVPEPNVTWLLVLGSVVLFARRRARA